MAGKYRLSNEVDNESMLVEVVCDAKSWLARKTKMEAVVRATIKRVNHVTFSTGPVELEAGATYFQPCNEVSRQYVANEVKTVFMSFFRTTPSSSS